MPPSLFLKTSPSHRRSELHLTQPRRPPEQRKDVLTAALVFHIFRGRRCERDAEDGIVQVSKPLGQRTAQRTGPRRELARLDVVQLEGVIGEAEDEQRGRVRRESEGVCGLGEGREGRVVLHRVEVEDVRAQVIICRSEPLAVWAYGHACDRGRHGLCVGGLGVGDSSALTVKFLGVQLGFGRIGFVIFVVSSPSQDTSFNHRFSVSVLIKPPKHPYGG